MKKVILLLLLAGCSNNPEEKAVTIDDLEKAVLTIQLSAACYKGVEAMEAIHYAQYKQSLPVITKVQAIDYCYNKYNKGEK